MKKKQRKAPQIYAKQILKHFELAEYFDDIQGSSMDGSKIHKEDVIQSALSDNQITDMQEVLMIGDRKHDVLGSGKFGISCVGVLYGYGSKMDRGYGRRPRSFSGAYLKGAGNAE